MVVLQVGDCLVVGTPEEAPCNVDGYEAAVNALDKEGLVDPDRIGIIGFSRTCYYVMQTLTASTLHVRAASITDGVMLDYLQYLMAVDLFGNGLAHEYDELAGAAPFGDGLQQWRARSPLFNIDKVHAPLLVVAGEGASTLQFMWGPYAALRYLHKPVELQVLNTEEHIQSNPAGRVASQGGTVDWFRFWLQGYEDPDPAKTEQYQRWEGLRALQTSQRQ
jgi:dipeptidyl aminopeptidase/acylaminoacyl peptidase